MTRLDSIGIEPPGEATASLIWLHGLGADGHDFEPLIPQLDIVERFGVRVVLPHAPVQPVTLNGGMAMRAWYDIRLADLEQAVDIAGIRRSVGLLQDLIAREQERGVPLRRILLAGFSQGGVIALLTGLGAAEPMGGLVGLSTYLPLAAQPAGEPLQCGAPVFLGHGSRDELVPEAAAERARDLLRGQGCEVELHVYEMGHAVCPPEIADLRAWLHARLAEAPA